MTVVVQRASLAWKIASMLVGFKFVFMLFLVRNCTSNRVGTISQSSSEFPCKLFRSTVGFDHLEKSPFVQASAHIASANGKKSKSQIFGPSARRAKNQNFWNLTNYIPLDPEFYADHYSQKDCTLESNFNKDMTRISLPSGKFL